jgi:hypothetical protein
MVVLIIKYGMELDWDSVLGKKGRLIRDIVSNADKIEALGKKDMKRCIEYSKLINQKSNDEQILENVEKHFHEKLNKLVNDGFIRTMLDKNNRSSS